MNQYVLFIIAACGALAAPAGLRHTGVMPSLFKTPVEVRNTPELDDFWLPDFCSASSFLRLFTMAVVIALFVLIDQAPVLWPFPIWDFLLITLLSAAVIALSFGLICRWRQRMVAWGHLRIALVVMALILFNLIWMGLFGITFLRYVGLPKLSFAPNEYSALARNLVLIAIFTALSLRYLILLARLRQREKLALRSRLEALQARIEPHFLFNSMNIIASLIATDPSKAEQVVEDLAALFRASLRDPVDVTLADEIALCRRYANIEEQRLGERLAIDWQLDEGLETVRIPLLTMQPILENAIRHSVELSAVRCDITLAVRINHKWAVLTLKNPLVVGVARAGNRMSLGNIRDRLQACFGADARLETYAEAGFFVTRMTIPRSR